MGGRLRAILLEPFTVRVMKDCLPQPVLFPSHHSHPVLDGRTRVPGYPGSEERIETGPAYGDWAFWAYRVAG